jgi:hypothetical protein
MNGEDPKEGADFPTSRESSSPPYDAVVWTPMKFACTSKVSPRTCNDTRLRYVTSKIS